MDTQQPDLRKFKRTDTAVTGTELPSTPMTTIQATSMETRNPASNSKLSSNDIAPNAVKNVSDEDSESDSKDYLDDYLSFLHSHGVSDALIRGYQKELLQGNTLRWECVIFKNKKVAFIPRPAWIQDKILEDFSKHPAELYTVYTSIISKHNLIGSLVHFDGIDFPPIDEDNYKEKEKYLRDLPIFIYEKLIKELVIFDRLMAVITDDKYLENFI